MATATSPTNRSRAAAETTLLPDGRALVCWGTQDLGTGTYTVMTQMAVDAPGLPVHQVRFELGDSRMPQAPVSGGSQSVARVSPAVKAACEELGAELVAWPWPTVDRRCSRRRLPMSSSPRACYSCAPPGRCARKWPR